jgi:hypothetical protein
MDSDQEYEVYDDSYNSEDEQYGYNSEDDLINVDEQIGEDISEIENGILSLDDEINNLQAKLNYMYTQLTEESIDLKEFEREIIIIQQKIANARINSIQQYLELTDLTNLRKEIEDVFEVAAKSNIPQLFLKGMANFDQKVDKLGEIEARIRIQVESIIDKYKMKKRETEISGSDVLESENINPKGISVDSIKWFVDRLPESDTESNNVIEFINNAFRHLSYKDSVNIFGSYEESRKVYNSLNKESDFSYLQSFIVPLIAFVESEYYKSMEAINNFQQEEKELLKKRLIKLNIFRNNEIETDFGLLDGTIPESKIQEIVEKNTVTPEEAVAIIKYKTWNKYSKYLPDGSESVSDVDIQKKDRPTIPIRNPKLLPWEDEVSKEVLDFESEILKTKLKDRKPKDIVKLRGILKQFSKPALIGCINKMSYRVMDPYIQTLYQNRIKVIKFRSNPESTKQLANSINKSIDELQLPRDFVKRELKKIENKGFVSSKVVLINTKPKKGGKFLANLPEDLGSKEFISNLKKYNSEFVVPATNQLFKSMVEGQYKSLKQGLESTKTFGYFMLDDSKIGQLKRAAVEDTLTPNVLESLNSLGKGGYGMSLQKLPNNSRQRGSFTVKVGSKSYKVVIDKPPSEAAFGWVLKIQGIGVIIPNFDDYLIGLRNLFRERVKGVNKIKNNETKGVILKKIIAINRYLNQPNLEGETVVPTTISGSVKELQFRLLERKKLYDFALTLDLPNINEDAIRLYITELERVAASCVSNVLTRKIGYLSKIAEIKFILNVYPQVFELLITNKLLPTDIINIRSSFNSYSLRRLETIEDLDTYLNWKPDTQTIQRFPDLYDTITSESEALVPNPTIIKFEDTKDLNITIMEKRAIMSESFEYITWAIHLKKIEPLVGKRESRKLASYLHRQKANLPSQITTPIVNTQTRISTVKKLGRKVYECRKNNKFVLEQATDEMLSSRIEMVVFKLSLNSRDYLKYISEILNDNLDRFCSLLIPNNQKLVGEIAKNYIIMPEVFKGKSELEVLANSSIPILRAIQSLQTNMIDIINNRETVNQEIRDMAKNIESKNNLVAHIIKRKKAIEDKEAFAIFEGKISINDIKGINKIESNKIVKRPVINMDEWRNSVYSPGVKYDKIPSFTYSNIIPLPLQRGFLIGGNYPDNPIPYRYIVDQELKSYLPEIINYFRSDNDFENIEFDNQDITQPPISKELSLVQEVQKILRLGFKLKPENQFTISELEQICSNAGYTADELSAYIPKKGEGPFIFHKNGDRTVMSLEDYITKEINEGNVYIPVEGIQQFSLDRLEKEYNKYIRLHYENLDPSIMYKRCIFDNIEPNKPIVYEDKRPKSKQEKKLMGLREFKKVLIKEYADKGESKPDEFQIVKEYFKLKGTKQIQTTSKPYRILDNQVFNVKFNKSIMFPVPLEHSGVYPVYTKSQLNDLGSLLLNGMLSPWLKNEIKPIYGDTPINSEVGGHVVINGKDSKGNKVDSIGIIKAIKGSKFKIAFDGGNKIGIFTSESFRPVRVDNITGFEGNPPWFIKEFNANLALEYLKSDEFKKLRKNQKLTDLTKIIREFSIFGDELNVNSVIKNLDKQYLKIKIVLKNDSLDKTKTLNFYKEFNLIDPTLLRNKIIEKYQNIYDTLNYLHSFEFKSKTRDDRTKDLDNIIAHFNFDTVASQPINESEIIKKLNNFRKPVDEALNFLTSDFWTNQPFNKRVVMYNKIAKSMNIENELIKPTNFKEKLKNRLALIQRAQSYIQDKSFNRLSNSEENRILIQISKDFGLDITVPSIQTIINRLETVRSRIGTLSNYYIEREFKDKYNKTITVKEGVSKTNIVWKSNDWDPCNMFTSSERNTRIQNTLKYLDSDKYQSAPNKSEILSNIKKYWKLKYSTLDKLVQGLKDKIDSSGFTKCVDGSTHQRVCILNSKKECVSRDLVAIQPIETPEQRILRLLTHYKDIDKLPVIKDRVIKEFKTYKKDDTDVWSWYPIKKPERMNKSEYLKWKSEPEVKLWNREINKGLRELESIIKGRVRTSSHSFKKRKSEITSKLEFFRKNMKSQRVVDKPLVPEIKKRKQGLVIPSEEIQLSLMYEEEMNKLLKYNIVVITKKAKKLLNAVENGKGLDLARVYNKFVVIEREQSYLDSNKKRVNSINVSSVSDRSINILDILKNMSETRKLEADISKDIKPSGNGLIFDYLVFNSKIKESYSNPYIPNNQVVITVRDVLDYLGDSYLQFGVYQYGIGVDTKENDVEYNYLSPPCRYIPVLNKNNPYLTFDDTGKYQNTYISDSDLHRNGVSTDVARRLALVLGIDLRTIPPCFATQQGKRAERKGSAISGEDVRTYFLRNGKGFTIDELDPDDIKNKSYRNLVFKKQKEHEALTNKYRKGLKYIFNNRQEGSIKEKTKLIVIKLKLDKNILNGLVDTVSQENTNRDKINVIKNINIPNKTNGTPFMRNETFKEIAYNFKNTYGVKLQDYTSNPKRNMTKNPIVIESWAKVN